jgi:hypothetical protein
MEQPNPDYSGEELFSSAVPGGRGPLGLAGRIDRFSVWINKDFAGQPGHPDLWQALSAYADSDGFGVLTTAHHQHAFAFKLVLRESSEVVAVFYWRAAERDWIRAR